MVSIAGYEFATFLTDAERARADYAERGFHVETGLIDAARCDALVAAALALPRAVEGIFRPAMNPHRVASIFDETMRMPAITSIMAQLIGGPLSGLQTEFFYCPPGTRGFACHQDNFFVEAPNDAFASAWAAMTDIEVDTGALRIFPRSHVQGRLPIRPLPPRSDVTQDPNAANEECMVADPASGVDLPMPKGAVVFLHGWVAHSSNDNVTDRFRYALLNTYLRRGEPFRPGRTAGRTEVPI
jgi:hypothetical protein